VAREILKLLFTINAAGTAVIMATHDHEVVRRYGHRIVHLEQGEIVKDEQAFVAGRCGGRRRRGRAGAAVMFTNSQMKYLAGESFGMYRRMKGMGIVSTLIMSVALLMLALFTLVTVNLNGLASPSAARSRSTCS